MKALAELHDNLEVMHRDLKLENLMLDGSDLDSNSTPRLKLIDFGLATAVSD